MKTYTEFISECYRIQENLQGGMVKFGYKQGRGFNVGVGVQGGDKDTQWDAGIDYERIAAGRVATPQTIQRGVAQADQNLGQTGQTSDAVGPQNKVGVTANVAGVIPQAPKPTPTPTPTPEEPKPTPTDKKFTPTEVRAINPHIRASLAADPKLAARRTQQILSGQNPKSQGEYQYKGADGKWVDFNPQIGQATRDAFKISQYGMGDVGTSLHQNDVDMRNQMLKDIAAGNATKTPTWTGIRGTGAVKGAYDNWRSSLNP